MKNTLRLKLIFAFIIGIGVSLYCHSIYKTFPNRWNLLTWDPAAHGWEGMRLAIDLQQFHLLQLLQDLNHLVLWPPLYALLSVPFYLAFGVQYPSAVLCSLTMLTLFFPAITFLYDQLDTKWPGWIVIMIAAGTSPLLLGFSSMPMMEITGATLTCFAAALFLKQSKWFPLYLALLFFLKYNYCIYLLLPVITTSLTKDKRDQVGEFARQNRVAFALIGLFAIFAAIVLITGGIKIGHISIRGIGNPAYITFLLFLAVLLFTKQYRPILNSIRGTGWEWFIFPVLIWLLIPVPNRIKTLISFSINKSLGGAGPSSFDYYTYYFGQLAPYFSNYWMTWIFLAVAIVITLLFWKKIEVRFVALMFTLPFLLMSINQNKQDRFLFTFFLALWILAAYAVDHVPNRYFRYTAAALLSIPLLIGFSPDYVRENIKRQFASLRSQQVLNFISSRIEDAEEVRVLGATNDVNPSSIAYHVAEQSGFRKRTHFEWELEQNPPGNLQVICINCETRGKLVRTRTFPDGMTVRHYFLDTSEAASYNPDQ